MAAAHPPPPFGRKPFLDNNFRHECAWRQAPNQGMNYHESVSPDNPFRGLGANPLGFELALETRNFRSRPLARQLGASVFLKVLVVQV